VILPVVLGILWLNSPATVFLVGAVLAGLSLSLSLNIPLKPTHGNEVIIGQWGIAGVNRTPAEK
jgi:hypothetical protein